MLRANKRPPPSHLGGGGGVHFGGGGFSADQQPAESRLSWPESRGAGIQFPHFPTIQTPRLGELVSSVAVRAACETCVVWLVGMGLTIAGNDGVTAQISDFVAYHSSVALCKRPAVVL